MGEPETLTAVTFPTWCLHHKSARQVLHSQLLSDACSRRPPDWVL